MTIIYDFIRRTLHLNVINLQYITCFITSVIFVYSQIKVSIKNKREFHSKIFRKLISFSRRGHIKIRIEKLQLRDFLIRPLLRGHEGIPPSNDEI